jgi:hypothetical protein
MNSEKIYSLHTNWKPQRESTTLKNESARFKISFTFKSSRFIGNIKRSQADPGDRTV